MPSIPVAAAAYHTAPVQVHDSGLKPNDIVILSLHAPTHRRDVWFATPLQVTSVRQILPLVPGSGTMMTFRRARTAVGGGAWIVDVGQLREALSCSSVALLSASVVERFGTPITFTAEYMGTWALKDTLDSERPVARPLAQADSISAVGMCTDNVLTDTAAGPLRTVALQTQLAALHRGIVTQARAWTMRAWTLAGHDAGAEEIADMESSSQVHVFFTAMGGFHPGSGRSISWACRDAMIPMAFHVMKHRQKLCTGYAAHPEGCLFRHPGDALTNVTDVYTAGMVSAISNTRALDIRCMEGWRMLCAMEALIPSPDTDEVLSLYEHFPAHDGPGTAQPISDVAVTVVATSTSASSSSTSASDERAAA